MTFWNPPPSTALDSKTSVPVVRTGSGSGVGVSAEPSHWPLEPSRQAATGVRGMSERDREVVAVDARIRAAGRGAAGRRPVAVRDDPQDAGGRGGPVRVRAHPVVED